MPIQTAAAPEVNPQPLIVVAGPTASGKSGLAVQLAGRLAGSGSDAEIVNADAMQLYRGMDIGTAKIPVTERQGVPHHMLDVLKVTEEASVAAYQRQARQMIAEIRGRGNTPILAGGSGLYLRAVVDAIEFPPTDPQTRAQVAELLEAQGAAEVRRQLRETDPESASVIKDDRRLIRALEVTRLTGRSFSSYMPQRVHQPSLEPVIQLGLRVNRDTLHQRIAARVNTMTEQGLIDEVKSLEAAGLREGATASQAIGYRQHLRVLDGEATVEEAIEETITATRKLARRQDTWFRADPRITWLEAASRTLVEDALEAIRQRTG